MTVFVAQKCSRAQRNAIESTESPPTCTHTHIRTGTHTCTLTYTQVHVNTCTHMYAYTHVYLHTCTHTDMYMYTYTHVHIHIHTCMRAPGAHPWIQTGAGRVWDKNKPPQTPVQLCLPDHFLPLLLSRRHNSCLPGFYAVNLLVFLWKTSLLHPQGLTT